VKPKNVKVAKTRAVLPIMRNSDHVTSFNRSSVAGVVGLKHCGAYGAREWSRSW